MNRRWTRILATGVTMGMLIAGSAWAASPAVEKVCQRRASVSFEMAQDRDKGKSLAQARREWRYALDAIEAETPGPIVAHMRTRMETELVLLYATPSLTDGEAYLRSMVACFQEFLPQRSER